jgi:hypothetical protein
MSNNANTARTLLAAATTTPATTTLIALNEIQEARPDWPFGAWWTGKLIRDKKLGCVRSGRRVFVTHAILDAYIAAHTVEVTP